ncbi:MAG: hypothetical protein HYY16_06420 [Planctomycetes bacterium]|nr:hypothetical protein [Planctomycetota bacterium]
MILANADAARNLGLEYVEIDLGYPSLSDDPWETNERFPHGHRWLTEQIRCMGLKPGLCIAPWTVPRVSEPFRRGWVFKGDDGAPQPMNMDYPGERWGETYCLDPSIPDACAWLKELGRRISQEWGYEYVKLDHLWQILGARRLGVNMTSMQAYRNGLAALRAGVGEKTLLIGSRADRGTYLPAADFLDGMKMREALGPDWASFLAAVDATAARWWLNGRAWWNHSGPLFVHEPLSLDEARTWASYVAVRGEAFMMGGDVPRLPPERLEVVRKALALRAEDARPVGLFAEDALDPSVWRARRGDGEVVLIMNVGLSDRAYSVPLGGRFRVSEEWSGQNLGEVDRIVWTLKPHACAVFLLSVSDR